MEWVHFERVYCMGLFHLDCGFGVMLNAGGMLGSGRAAAAGVGVLVRGTYFLKLPSDWNQGGSSHQFPPQTSRTWYKENTRAWEFHTALKAKHK